jgi:hypothetical protein
MGTPIIVVEPVILQAFNFGDWCAVYTQLADWRKGGDAFPIDAFELVGETGCGEFAFGLFEEGVGDVDLKGSWGGHVVIGGGKVGQSWAGVRTSFGEATVSTAAIRKCTP